MAKVKPMFTVLFLSCLLCGTAWAQVPLLKIVIDKSVDEVFQSASKETLVKLTEIGGRDAVTEMLEKAGEEGGESLVRQATKLVIEDGPGAICGITLSPAVMVKALEETAPELRPAAIQALDRDPQTLTNLTVRYGHTVLEEAARHPGVGEIIAQKLGSDGMAAAEALDTPQAILLARYADDVAALSSPEQNSFWEMLKSFPGETLDQLEKHPGILKNGTHVIIAGELVAGGVAGLYALRQEIFGKPDAQQHGMVERIVHDSLVLFQRPISTCLVVIAAILAVIAGVHVWKAWKLTRLRIDEIVQTTPAIESTSGVSALDDSPVRTGGTGEDKQEEPAKQRRCTTK